MEKKEVDKFINEWNMFIEAVKKAKKCWERLRAIRHYDGFSAEAFPDDCQKVLARANFRSRFVVGVIRFLEYVERFSSLEACLIEKKNDEKIKNEEVKNVR